MCPLVELALKTFRLVPGLCDGSDEPVSASRNSLDITRRRGIVPENGADLPNTVVQSKVEINEGVAVAPQLLLDFLASNHFTRALYKQEKKFQRLRLESDRRAEFRKSPFREIQMKNAERYRLGVLRIHSSPEKTGEGEGCSIIVPVSSRNHEERYLIFVSYAWPLIRTAKEIMPQFIDPLPSPSLELWLHSLGWEECKQR